MNNFSQSQEQKLDDQLSEFTDKILSDEDEATMPEAINPNELVELQKTILRMKAAAQQARTSDNADTRIRNRLQLEWKKAKQAERPAPKRFVWNWSFQRLALAGGFAVLILFSVVTLFTPTTTPLVGTADGSQSWSPLVIFTGIVIVILLVWHNRRN